jgi:hypothetical protein
LIGAASVHTTGVNIEGILANTVALVVILTAFTTFIIKMVNKSIKAAVVSVVTNEVTPVLKEINDQLKAHDTRIAKLEGIEVGRRYAVDAAGVGVIKRVD